MVLVFPLDGEVDGHITAKVQAAGCICRNIDLESEDLGSGLVLASPFCFCFFLSKIGPHLSNNKDLLLLCVGPVAGC